MIEVEAKIKISNPNKFRRKALSLSKYQEKIKKVDNYYTLEPLTRYPKKSLRIRKMNSHYIVNFKQRISYKSGIFAKKETEFKVSDINGFLALIKDFGFRKWLTKEKITFLYKIKDNFHIELNYIKNLGWFAEVEYLCFEKDIRKARLEVSNVLKALGIKPENAVKDGYTKLLWDKRKR